MLILVCVCLYMCVDLHAQASVKAGCVTRCVQSKQRVTANARKKPWGWQERRRREATVFPMVHRGGKKRGRCGNEMNRSRREEEVQTQRVVLCSLLEWESTGCLLATKPEGGAPACLKTIKGGRHDCKQTELTERDRKQTVWCERHFSRSPVCAQYKIDLQKSISQKFWKLVWISKNVNEVRISYLHCRSIYTIN